MKPFSVALFGASVFIGGVTMGPADAADPVKWKASFIGPPQIHMNRAMLKPWTDRINEDGKGAIEITIVPGLANFENAYDTVRNGISQIGTVQPNSVRGKFDKLTAGPELPFVAKDGREATFALWQMHEKGLFTDLFDEVVPIGLVAFPQVSVHAKVPIKSLEDLKGRKVAAGSAMGARIVDAFGGSAVGLAPSEINQALDKGVVTHSFNNYNGIVGFGAMNLVSHHLDTNLGSSTLLLVANKAAWEKAPEQAKAALRKHGFGNMTKAMGNASEDPNQEDLAKLKAAANHTFVYPTDADRARWEKHLAPMVEKWIGTIPNGAAVAAAYKQGVLAARNTR